MGFDISKTFAVPLLSGEERTVQVRFPSDAEWCAQAKQIRILIHDLGRGKTEREVVGAEDAASTLYALIRLEASPDLDAFEARAVIDQLEAAELLGIEREGQRFTVTLAALGQELKHVLRMPTQRQIHDYHRARLRAVGIRRGQEIRQSLEPGAALYDALVENASGYDGTVPIIHKQTVTMELLAEIESIASEGGGNAPFAVKTTPAG